MKTLELKGTPRADFGKRAAKGIRKSGDVPCVMYGGEEVKHFQIREEDLRALLYTPEVLLVKLSLEGKEHLAILKEAQYHPVKDTTLHIDLLEVFENKPIVVALPIHLKGHAAGVKAGGKLSLDMRKIKVKGLYKDMPESIDIDVSDLELGKSIKVADLKFDNLEMVSPKAAGVCSVKATRAAAQAASETAAE